MPEGYEKRVYKLRSGAELAGVSQPQLKYAIDHGALKARKMGGQWLIDRSDLEAWIAKGKPKRARRFPDGE